MLMCQEQIELCDHSSCMVILVSNLNISTSSPRELYFALFPQSQTSFWPIVPTKNASWIPTSRHNVECITFSTETALPYDRRQACYLFRVAFCSMCSCYANLLLSQHACCHKRRPPHHRLSVVVLSWRAVWPILVPTVPNNGNWGFQSFGPTWTKHHPMGCSWPPFLLLGTSRW